MYLIIQGCIIKKPPCNMSCGNKISEGVIQKKC